MDSDDDVTTYSDAFKSPVAASPRKRLSGGSNALQSPRASLPTKSLETVAEDTERDISKLDRPQEQRPQEQRPQPETQKTATEDVIRQQQLKVQLLQEKDRLLAMREQLEVDVQKGKRKVRQLKETKQALVADKTLEALIQQNNSEFAPDAVQRRSAIAEEKDDSGTIESALNVKPSHNWELRLQYIKRFLKHIQLHNAVVRTERWDNGLVRIYDFCAYAPDLFRVPLSLYVEAEKLHITKITVDIPRSVYLFTSSNVDEIFDRLCKEGRIHDVLRTLDSLAGMVKERARFWYSVAKLCSKYISDGWPNDAFSHVLTLDNPGEQILLRDLKTQDHVTIDVPPSPGEKETRRISFEWQILIYDCLDEGCAASLNIYVNGNKGMAGQISPIFLKLIETCGIEEGIRALFASLYDLEL